MLKRTMKVMKVKPSCHKYCIAFAFTQWTNSAKQLLILPYSRDVTGLIPSSNCWSFWRTWFLHLLLTV